MEVGVGAGVAVEVGAVEVGAGVAGGVGWGLNDFLGGQSSSSSSSSTTLSFLDLSASFLVRRLVSSSSPNFAILRSSSAFLSSSSAIFISFATSCSDAIKSLSSGVSSNSDSSGSELENSSSAWSSMRDGVLAVDFLDIFFLCFLSTLQTSQSRLPIWPFAFSGMNL